MSYNILSQDLLEDNIYLYRHCRYSILNWAYRLLNILKEIQELNADILCLQEVQDNHYRKQIKPRLEEMGYQCEYKMRTGSKPDGCAICFKRSKFTLVEAKPVEFYRRSIQLLDRDNVGLITLLRPIVQCDTPSNICVANTHLLYNPRRGDIKLTQLAILLAEMNRMACQEDGTYCPVILCGDFNSAPFSPLYDFIVEGRLNYYGLAIGRVSGQESPRRGQRELPVPIWPKKLGISQNCQYETDQQPASEDTKAEPSAESDDESSEESDEELSPDTERLLSQLRHSFWLSSVYSHYLSGTDEPEVTTCHSKTSLTVDYIFYSSARNIYVQPAETTEYAVRMEQWRTTWEQVKLQHQEWTPVPPAAVREPRSPHNPQAVVEQQWNVWKDSFKGEKNDEMGPAEGLTKWGQNQETENNMNEFNKDQHIAASQQDQPKHPEDSAAETTVEPQSSSTAQIMKEKCSYSEKLAEKKDGNSKFKFKEEQYTGTSLQDHTKPQENSASTETMLESHSLSIARKMEEQSSHLEGTAEEHKNDGELYQQCYAQNEEKLNEQEKYEEAWRLYNEEYERKWRKYEKDLNTWRLYKEEKAAYDFQMEQWRTAQQQEGSLVAETPVGDYDVSSHPQKMEEEWSSWESHAKEHWNNDAKNTNHKSLKLIGRLSLLTERDLWKVDGLPNERNSSDHIPLLAKFRLDL
ncbi:protein angel homolog 2 isoform X1 [Protopterus annectens]|uniref:protein angel homolog 2 isoform X1 n=1 Tax=Protopterus annectens TaxID=7888 RepID=UPI001CFA495E|nr:protein angel homolog 2 isoform X1 [Protopterus annectens]